MTTFGNTREALAAAKTRMEKAVDDFRKDLATLRTGRANASLLDSIRVDYHGTPMPVNQLGTVTTPDATMIVISPWDPSAVPLIDKAIRTSDLGLNPTNDGKVVRVPIPSLTEDRRKDMQRAPRFEGSHREAREGQKNQRRREEARAGRAGKAVARRDQEDRGSKRGKRKRNNVHQVVSRGRSLLGSIVWLTSVFLGAYSASLR